MQNYNIILTLSNGEQISVVANLEEYFGGPSVSQVGTGTMCTLPNGTVKVVLTLRSNANVKIIGVYFNSQTYSVMKTLTRGINNVTIYLPNTSVSMLQPGDTITLALDLNVGTTIAVTATYVGQC